ncbi:hypothetical protein WME91_56220 [Sorangium sp. So ce269]
MIEAGSHVEEDGESPHGDGAVKHMHLRYGDAEASFAGLLGMSDGDEGDADECNPWWSVYCSAGSEGCDI